MKGLLRISRLAVVQAINMDGFAMQNEKNLARFLKLAGFLQLNYEAGIGMSCGHFIHRTWLLRPYFLGTNQLM